MFEQLTLDDLIRSGAYDRQLHRSRLRCRRRRDHLLAARDSTETEVGFRATAAGLHAVVEPPAGAPPRSRRFAPGQHAGLALMTLSAYRHSPEDATAALVVGDARAPQHAHAADLELPIYAIR